MVSRTNGNTLKNEDASHSAGNSMTSKLQKALCGLIRPKKHPREDLASSPVDQHIVTTSEAQHPQSAQDSPKNDLSALYVLNRDYLGSCRLNLQYYLWKESLGFNLHPSIPVKSLGSNPRVADIATGTGIWLLESRNLFPPEAQLDGFDVDLSQAPHHKWLPSNVSLTHWDMFTEVPEDLVAVYDVVHIRLVMLVLKDNNPVPLIQNLLKLLKPGGYLQWDEVNQMAKNIIKVDDSVRADGINAMFRVDLPEGAKGSDNWQKTLPETLIAHNFSSAKGYQFNPSLECARYWHDMYTLAWDEVLTNTLGDKASQALMAADQGMNEVRNGAAISMPLLVWVARK